MSGQGVARLLGAEAMKLRRQTMTAVLLGILVVGVVVIHVLFATLLTAPDAEGVDRDGILAPMRIDGLAFAVSLFSGTATILLIIFAASIVGDEYSKGTLRTLLVGRARRGDIVLTKALVVLGVAASLAVVAVIVAVLGMRLFSTLAGEDLLRLPEDAAAVLLARAARTFVAYATWGLLAYALAMRTHSGGAAIGIVLGVYIVGDVTAGLLSGLGTLGETAARLLPNTALGTLTGFGPMSLSASEWAWTLGVPLVYVGVSTWVAARHFLRMDALAASKLG